jgi:hypothetical protein
MTDQTTTTTPITDQARNIGHRPYQPAMVEPDQQLANAVENIAIQMSLINQKMDLLIEVIERAAPRS